MKKIVILIFLMIFMFLGSCKKMAIYPDTNGDDNYSLETIKEEELIKKSSGIVIGFVSTTELEGGATIIKQSAMEFNGVRQVNKFRKGSYEIVIDFIVYSGNTRLVLTDGSQIIYEFSPNELNQSFSFEASSNYYLKLSGESLRYELNIEITKK